MHFPVWTSKGNMTTLFIYLFYFFCVCPTFVLLSFSLREEARKRGGEEGKNSPASRLSMWRNKIFNVHLPLVGRQNRQYKTSSKVWVWKTYVDKSIGFSQPEGKCGCSTITGIIKRSVTVKTFRLKKCGC